MSESQEADRATGSTSETVFKSVGIDVGSSTTHLTISELRVGRIDSHFHRKPEILERKAIYRSNVMFTPFRADGFIDHDAIRSFVQKSYSEAGIDVGDIGSGAVICTGEAARRQNAKAITESLAKDSGKFVCATAGHHFEAVLAAHGSGSVEVSHYFDGLTVNIDIGGGTTKRTLIRDGIIENTSAINVGARLIAIDANGIVTRCEPAGKTIAESLGIDSSPGHRLDSEQRLSLTSTMARLILAFLAADRKWPLVQDLLLTSPPAPLPDRLIMTQPPRCVPKPFRLLCSGGVSEFIYQRSDMDTGDLGPLLGEALRNEFCKRFPEDWLLHPKEGIRATVIGACQFTLQASGDTVFISDHFKLPVNNVPVLSVSLDWGKITAEHVELSTRQSLEAADQISSCALYFGGPKQFGYGKLASLARGIAEACRQRPTDERWIFIFSHNIANTVGCELQRCLPADTPFLCLDEVEVGNLDYVDIGVSPPGDSYLPVVIKSLVFQSTNMQKRERASARA
jgi:ethanolamine utilization protein EutA